MYGFHYQYFVHVSLKKLASCSATQYSILERTMGIEPTPSAWEANILPINYIRIEEMEALFKSHHDLKWFTNHHCFIHQKIHPKIQQWSKG